VICCFFFPSGCYCTCWSCFNLKSNDLQRASHCDGYSSWSCFNLKSNDLQRASHCDGYSVIGNTLCGYRFGSMRMMRICSKGPRPGSRCHTVRCMSAHAGGLTRTAWKCCTGHATLHSMRSTPFRPVAMWLLCCTSRCALWGRWILKDCQLVVGLGHFLPHARVANTIRFDPIQAKLLDALTIAHPRLLERSVTAVAGLLKKVWNFNCWFFLLDAHPNSSAWPAHRRVYWRRTYRRSNRSRLPRIRAASWYAPCRPVWSVWFLCHSSHFSHCHAFVALASSREDVLLKVLHIACRVQSSKRRPMMFSSSTRCAYP
jgi:hypothetical protein